MKKKNKEEVFRYAVREDLIEKEYFCLAAVCEV